MANLGLCPCGRPATRRVEYRNKTHIDTCTSHAWEYENDPDWFRTIEILPSKPPAAPVEEPPLQRADDIVYYLRGRLAALEEERRKDREALKNLVAAFNINATSKPKWDALAAARARLEVKL